MDKKKCMKILAVLMILVFCISACGKRTVSDPEPAKNEETSEKADKTDTDKGIEDSEKKEDTQTPENTQKQDGSNQTTDPSQNEVKITVFYSNDDATAFAKEDVSIGSLSPEEVLKALVSKGAVPAAVSIVEFKTSTVDGKSSAEIDFNNAFATYVKGLGTTGEYYAIGSVCNTFLNAFDCQQVKITVEGQNLETGHAEYPGYMTQFE